jgi:hypothetical protein
MKALTGARWRSESALVVLACVLLLIASPGAAVKRAVESVNCGGGESSSASYRAHDTIAQCPIGPVGEGGGMRIYDGFWLTLPNINVPVEGAVFAALLPDGTPVVRWTVATLDDIRGFNVYRAVAEDGPYELINQTPIEPRTPGMFVDTTTWPQTTFWYEVRALHPGDVEEAIEGSPAWTTTEGRLALTLRAFAPNPMTESATISFDIPDGSGEASLVIYNVRGQRVRTVIEGPIGRGRHERTWDGADGFGRTVASGVYFARLVFDGHSRDQKVMVLR